MFDFKIKPSDKKLRLNIIFFRIKKTYHKPRNKLVKYDNFLFNKV